MKSPEEIIDGLQALIESHAQAVHDLCGEQREFHLPRLSKAMIVFCSHFGAMSLRAMERAKDAYGELLAQD